MMEDEKESELIILARELYKNTLINKYYIN